MGAIPAVLLSVLKGIVIKLASEKFLTWLFFWAAEMLAESTKTDKDDKFVQKAREAYYGENDASESKS